MTGEELLQILVQMTPEERNRTVIAPYWVSEEESSGFEETLDFWSCKVGDIRHNAQDVKAIVLE